MAKRLSKTSTFLKLARRIYEFGAVEPAWDSWIEEGNGHPPHVMFVHYPLCDETGLAVMKGTITRDCERVAGDRAIVVQTFDMGKGQTIVNVCIGTWRQYGSTWMLIDVCVFADGWELGMADGWETDGCGYRMIRLNPIR